MKLIKQPIQIVVHFTQKGEIKPIAFLYKNCHYKVVNILHVKDDYSFHTGNIKIFRLQVVRKNNPQDERICEVTYIKEEERWILNKI